MGHHLGFHMKILGSLLKANLGERKLPKSPFQNPRITKPGHKMLESSNGPQWALEPCNQKSIR